MNKAQRQTVVVILIMAILPALSWMYMKKGANYRKNTLEDEFNLVDSIQNWTENADIERTEYSLLYDIPTSTYIDVIVPLEKVFKGEAKRLEFVNLRDTTANVSSDIRAQLKVIDPAADAFLIRKNGIVYNSYDCSLDDAEELMFSHIAFVMPPKVREKIVFKREGEK